jgi:hypothetical protein
MSTRLNDPRTSGKVVVMQRCHQQDLSGHLLVARQIQSTPGVKIAPENVHWLFLMS